MKLYLILLLTFQICIHASDLHLFNTEGKFNDQFATSILSGDLHDGESIFLHEKQVTYKGILGSGNTTIILRVFDPQERKELALRLPHGNSKKNYDIYDGKRFLNQTFEGYQELLDTNLPIPKVHSFKRDSYLLVDLVEHDFDLRTFLARNENFDVQEKTKIVESLVNFAKDTAIYQSIGDFDLQQVVYSTQKNKWYLLDWTSKHQLARLPSSPMIFSEFLFSENNKALNSKGTILMNDIEDSVPRTVTEFERQTLERLHNEIEEQRRQQGVVDNIEFEKIKNRLQTLSDHKKVINLYKEIKNTHMASFYTLLQRDFIDNQILKFPQGMIGATDLKALLDGLGKFTPFYFSEFSGKILSSLNDLEAFMILYKKINLIGLDEEDEDDIATAIAKNMERILSNTTSSPENDNIINKLKEDYGVINYQTREILSKANELLKTPNSCTGNISSFLQLTD